MHLLGHVGISLLLFSPIAWLLLSAGHVGSAVAIGGLMVALGPLPDLDEYTDRLAHRGPTHTVWFALGVGVAVGLAGGVSGVVLDAATPGSVGAEPSGFGPVGVESLATWLSIGGLEPLATGLWLGGVATLALGGHLAGDVGTPMGLWPFRPLSARHYSFALTPSKDPRANRLCFAAGVGSVAIAVLGAV